VNILVEPSRARPPPTPEEPVEQVTVRSKPPPRSASDWEVDHDTIRAAPHQDGADALNTLPGVLVEDRGLFGRAPRLSLRGFNGTAGQDVEMFVGNVPLNQVSNIRAPGYADTRFIMPEVLKTIRVTHGPYDPHQGDFAVAGSVNMDLGLEDTGFLAKGTYGSFDSRRIFLGFAPADRHWRDSFAAFETSASDGPGTGRGGDRSSFIGQLAFQESQVIFRGVAGAGTARFDFPGFLAQRDVEAGAYPFGATPGVGLGRDRAQTAFLGAEVIWEVANGALSLGSYATHNEMEIHQNLTGYTLDILAGQAPTNPDDGEQVNKTSNIGLVTSYKHAVDLFSKRDNIEVGAQGKLDFIDQRDTRLFADGTINQKLVDASISATNLAAYADAALYPIRHVVVRGGVRLDSLSYAIDDHTQNLGLSRTAQGFHVGEKAVIDYAAGNGIHVVGAYGEGFRSPQVRDLTEGEKVPFAIVRSVELGARVRDQWWQASASAFQSWLDQDRIFDPTARENVAAPSSSRTGVAAALSARAHGFLVATSATYTRAVFTGTDARFHEGDTVPYAPPFVAREDASYSRKIGKLRGEPVTARVGAGLEGAAGAVLPGGGDAKNVFFLDALAAVAWREGELTLAGTNLLDLRYYDAQYVYVSNFERSPTLPPPSARVLVAPPASVFLTLRIHIDTQKKEDAGGDDVYRAE
jgi:hypothetical protein